MRSANDMGFTLIELLVVIAIIAVLVLIVVVAINPAERLRIARDQEANSNVRSYAGAIDVCITGELQKDPAGDPFKVATCGDNTDGSGNYLTLPAQGYGNKPNDVEVLVGDSDGDSVDDQICLYEEGRSESGVPKYASWKSSEGNLIPSPLGVTTCT